MRKRDASVIEDPFQIGVELSAKQEVKRHVIAEKHKDKIAALFA